LAVCGAELPGLGFREVAPLLREQAPRLAFVVLTQRWSQEELREATQAGASSYVEHAQLAQMELVVRREFRSASDHRQHLRTEKQGHHASAAGEHHRQHPLHPLVKDAEERRLRVANKTFADMFNVTKSGCWGSWTTTTSPGAGGLLRRHRHGGAHQQEAQGLRGGGAGERGGPHLLHQEGAHPR
jgi:CheY-like chemotaxis protein